MTCLLEYLLPRKLPSHTSYDLSASKNAAKHVHRIECVEKNLAHEIVKLIFEIFTEGATGRIDDPSAGRFKDPVLKENRFLGSTRRLGWNAVNFQNVPD